MIELIFWLILTTVALIAIARWIDSTMDGHDDF